MKKVNDEILRNTLKYAYSILLENGYEESEIKEGLKLFKKYSNPTKEDMEILYNIFTKNERLMKIYLILKGTIEDLQELERSRRIQ